MGDVVKRVWVLNRGAFFAKERYLFLPVVFFFIPMGVLFLVLFGETGPTRKRSRAFAGKRGRRGGGNEISSPPRARAPTKEFSLARKKKESAFRRKYHRVAHRAMRAHYSFECLSRFRAIVVRDV